MRSGSLLHQAPLQQLFLERDRLGSDVTEAEFAFANLLNTLRRRHVESDDPEM